MLADIRKLHKATATKASTLNNQDLINFGKTKTIHDTVNTKGFFCQRQT